MQRGRNGEKCNGGERGEFYTCLSYTRFSDALNRLAYDRTIGRSGMHKGFLIERFVDWRPDAKGVIRLLVVWHLREDCGPVDPWSAAAWTELAVDVANGQVCRAEDCGRPATGEPARLAPGPQVEPT